MQMYRIKKVMTLAGVAIFLPFFAACSAGGDESESSDTSGSIEEMENALQEGGELTFWSWTPHAQEKVDAFEAKYPNVDVTLVNAGSAADEYKKLSNAIQAGKGVPDVVQIDYTAMPQYIYSGDLLDLTPYGFGDLKSDFLPGAWGAMEADGGVYGLPEDSGPTSLYYNKAVYDANGIEVPSTWDEFVDAARKLHESDPSTYLASETPDGLQTLAGIQLAGGNPFTVEGTSININLQDEGSKKWADLWNKLLQEDLLSTTPQWSDDWYKQLGNGEIASLITGAWMPGLLEASASDASGDWRVAPLPTYDGTPISANNGGSGESVMASTANPALAAGFLKYINSDPEAIQIMVNMGSFPSTVAALESPELADLAPEYFGGEKINQVALESAQYVNPDFQFLPYQNYANEIFVDSVGQSFANHTDLNEGLRQWQEDLVEYGNQQGFTVTEG